jgi:hypothetical protein
VAGYKARVVCACCVRVLCARVVCTCCVRVLCARVGEVGAGGWERSGIKGSGARKG